MVDEEVLEDFLAESGEHLDRAERELLELESFQGGPDETLELLNRLFRAVHSIKGAAGFLELQRIVELTHAMENIFGTLRERRQKPDPACADLMLEGIDLLRQMLQNVHDSQAVDAQSAVHRLHLYEAGMNRPDGSPRATSTPCATFASAAMPTSNDETDPAEPRGEYHLRIEAPDLEAAARDIAGIARIEARDQQQILAGSVLEADLLFAAIGQPQAKVTALNWKAYRQLIAACKGAVEEANRLASPAIAGTLPRSASVPATTGSPSPAGHPAASATPGNAPLAKAGAATKAAPVEHSVRVDLGLLEQLMALAGELVLVRNRHLRWLGAGRAEDEAGREIAQRLDTVTTELQTAIMKTRMQPLERVFGKLPRLVREVAKQLGKEIELTIEGAEVEVDRAILESLADPLTHLLRNSCDHGIELPAARQEAGKPPAGTVRVSARHESGQIRIEIADDGKGIDPDFIGRKAVEKGLLREEELQGMDARRKLGLIMLPGFSTASAVSSISGRGVGMDVVKSSVEKLGGHVEIDSIPGRGSQFILRLPLTLAIIQSLIVREGGRRYLIPRINLEEVITISGSELAQRVHTAAGQEVLEYQKSLLQLVRLAEVLKNPQPLTPAQRADIAAARAHDAAQQLAAGQQPTLDVAVVRVGERRFGLAVEETQEMEEIVVKPLHPSQEGIKIFLGVTVTGDGRVAPILDVEGVARHALDEVRHNRRREGAEKFAARSDDAQKVLLFESAPGEQFAIGLSFIRRIHSVPAGELETIGPRLYARIGGKPVVAARLEQALPVLPAPACEEYYLIMPRFGQTGCGILATRICGIGEVAADFSNAAGSCEDGLLGTAVVNGSTTLFPDIYHVCETALGISTGPALHLDNATAPSHQNDEGHATSEEAAGASVCPAQPEQPENPQAAQDTGGSLSPAFRNAPEITPAAGKRVRKVLLAEDAPFFRQLIMTYLRRESLQVDTVPDGAQAWEKLAREEYDLVLSDIEMPVMDGRELVRRIRAEERFKKLPVVALTSLDTDEDRQECLRAGFSEYQIKLNREQLLKMLRRYLAG